MCMQHNAKLVTQISVLNQSLCLLDVSPLCAVTAVSLTQEMSRDCPARLVSLYWKINEVSNEREHTHSDTHQCD